ncbi:MAG: hypothetical protein E7022_08760 [Desulfovibrio desulfuricans]|nr:hypothetical protein [Desulfovibrio desulfuricans]
MPVVARIGMLWLLLWAWVVLPGAPAQAVPLTTKYYSLALPADWVVVNGPAEVKGAVQVLLGQKDHKSSVLLLVGPARPGEAQQAAEANARRLGGGKPVQRGGQWEFFFEQKGVRGCGIAREDKASGLLLMLLVSGDLKRADFVYAMRGPYKALIPNPPQRP